MASEVQSVLNPTLSLVHGSQALTTTNVTPNSGKVLPQNGKTAAPAVTLQIPAALQQSAAPAVLAQTAQQAGVQQALHAGKTAKAAAQASPLPVQVAQLNKQLNDSGRPAQFRASTDNKNVEEINPATGAVVAEYSASEFPALARSVGISGVTVNSLA